MTWHFRRSTGALGLAALAGAGALWGHSSPGVAAPLAPTLCSSTWSRVTSPNTVGTNVLLGIAGATPSDLWAVGYSGTYGSYSTEALHWDGTDWTLVASPNAGPGNNTFAGVAAVSSTDVWAAGHVDPPNGGLSQTILTHWNGTAWSLDPNPVPGTLLGITAPASDNVWTVGYVGDLGSYHTLIRHWNGSVWTTVPSPDGGAGDNYLTSIAGSSATDLWTVGYRNSGGSNPQTLTEHWNGAVWALDPQASGGTLESVISRSPSDAWAVGFAGQPQTTLTRHWDGSSWTTVPSPNGGTGDSYFLGVTALVGGDVWAAGANQPPNGGATQPLLGHWDGQSWTLEPPPSPGVLWGIMGTANQELWAVGYIGNFGSYQTLIANSKAQCVKATPTRTSTTTTTSTPTATLPPLSATATATATLTPCSSVTWNQITSPSAAGTNYLLGVSGVTASDVWTVGYSGANGSYHTEVLHWNGTAWTLVASPNAGPGNNSFAGVAAVSSTDVWAAGHVDPPHGGLTQTLLAHWNGTAWTLDPNPVPGTLLGITALASDNVWTVGYVGDLGNYHTLIRHWNGSVWSTVPSPDGGAGDNYLHGVGGSSAGDLWAVGYVISGGGTSQTLILHWDGQHWTRNTASIPGALQAVEGWGASNAWVVGQQPTSGGLQTLTQHWDGTTWNTVASPNAGLGTNVLSGVVAVNATDTWAIGHIDPPNGGLTQTIIAHWNGRQWTLDPQPVPGTLLAVTALASGGTGLARTDLWTVGYVGDYEAYQTLILHRHAQCAMPTAIPTILPPIATPSPMPTVCEPHDVCDGPPRK